MGHNTRTEIQGAVAELPIDGDVREQKYARGTGWSDDPRSSPEVKKMRVGSRGPSGLRRQDDKPTATRELISPEWFHSMLAEELLL